MSITVLSWTISLTVAATGALAFLVVTLVTGDYDWVARVGGSAWVFLLAVIILLPTVMPALRERAARQMSVGAGQSTAAGEPQATGVSAKEEVSAMAKDPVCGMDVDPKTAAGSSEYKGETYYFCNLSCKQSFDENPEQYITA